MDQKQEMWKIGSQKLYWMAWETPGLFRVQSLLKFSTKSISKQKYLYPIVPHAAPGCAPNTAAEPYFTGV
jgi:hypothetical protein